MKIYKTRFFTKWARKEKIHDQHLLTLINEIHSGNFGVSLGGQLYKKRIALGNRGKRAGSRVILTFLANNRAFFLYGFRKKEMENIETQELNTLKKLAEKLLNYTEEQLHKAIFDNNMLEVKQYEKERA